MTRYIYSSNLKACTVAHMHAKWQICSTIIQDRQQWWCSVGQGHVTSRGCQRFPRSPNLMPCDFFLRSYVKKKVHVHPCQQHCKHCRNALILLWWMLAETCYWMYEWNMINIGMCAGWLRVDIIEHL